MKAVSASPEPMTKWARANKDFQYLLVQPLLRSDALLLLVQPDIFAFMDVQSRRTAASGRPWTITSSIG